MKIITLFTVLSIAICMPINVFAEVRRDTSKKTSPTYAKLGAKLEAQDAAGFIALLPPHITNVSKPNTDEAADLLLQALKQKLNPSSEEIIMALILRGAECNKPDNNNKTAIDYLVEKETSGDVYFAPAMQEVLKCEQRHCKDARLDVAKRFLDAVITKKADVAFDMLGEKGKKQIPLQELSNGLYGTLLTAAQGTVSCVAVKKVQNMDVVFCFLKTVSDPGIYPTNVQVGKESGQLKAFTYNP